MDTRNYRIVSLETIRDNFLQIRRSIPERIRTLAVVKADAYGHGAFHVAKTVLDAGADMLAVATASEGAYLRENGIVAPILVLGAVTGNEVMTGVQNDLIQTVCSPEMVAICEKACEELQTECRVHLKIDSGMGRIGVRNISELAAVTESLAKSTRVKLTGVYTHFADADGTDDGYTLQQYARFTDLTRSLPDNIVRHCANSAAIHRYPEMYMDMVRIGISLYGYPPVENRLNLHPAMEWHATVSYVKTIETGEAVSYGMIWCAQRPSRIATITCGYGDGYHRAATGRTSVLIHGKKAPVVGRICMDQMMADVSDIPETKPGDDVILMGQDGSEKITAEDIATAAGTISYEVLLAATGRVRIISEIENGGTK